MTTEAQEKKERLQYNGRTLNEFVEELKRLMALGHSNKTAAAILGVTPGIVAGMRHRKHIPSKNAPGSASKIKKRRNLEISPAEIRRLGLRESPSEAARCESKEVECPFEAQVGTLYCRLHQQEGQ